MYSACSLYKTTRGWSRDKQTLILFVEIATSTAPAAGTASARGALLMFACAASTAACFFFFASSASVSMDFSHTSFQKTVPAQFSTMFLLEGFSRGGFAKLARNVLQGGGPFVAYRTSTAACKVQGGTCCRRYMTQAMASFGFVVIGRGLCN